MSEQNKIPPDEYNSILAAVELDAVYLSSFSGELIKQDLDIPRVISKLNESCGHEIASAKKFTIYQNYKLTGKEGKKNVIKIECSFAIAFSSEKKVTEAFIDQFKQNASVICFPYLREYLSSVTTRMNLPALFLPLIKIAPTQQKHVE